MAQASVEKLEPTGPAEKERVASVPPQRAVGKYARAALAKKKGNRAVSSKYQIARLEKVKVSESCTLAREVGQSGSMEKKGWIPQ